MRRGGGGIRDLRGNKDARAGRGRRVAAPWRKLEEVLTERPAAPVSCQRPANTSPTVEEHGGHVGRVPLLQDTHMFLLPGGGGGLLTASFSCFQSSEEHFLFPSKGLRKSAFTPFISRQSSIQTWR